MSGHLYIYTYAYVVCINRESGTNRKAVLRESEHLKSHLKENSSPNLFNQLSPKKINMLMVPFDRNGKDKSHIKHRTD